VAGLKTCLPLTKPHNWLNIKYEKVFGYSP
jgi:hypothetical protein